MRTPEKMSRRLALSVIAAGLAVVAEEITIGIGRRTITSAVQRTLYEPTPCQDVSDDSPVGSTLDRLTNNRESKRYNYTLYGIDFVSDSIPEEKLKPDLEAAIGKIGGPYWNPGCPYVIEDGKIVGRDAGLPRDAELNITDNHRQVMITTPEPRIHELIHLLIGPNADKWPYILGEFFAHAASPERNFTYTPRETNHPSVSMVRHEWAATQGHNYFIELRTIVLAALSKGMSDARRIAMCKAAIEKGSMDFKGLPDFVRQFGLDHAIFRPGVEGDHHHAFRGSSIDGREWVLLVNYRATAEQEHPLFGTVQLIPKDGNGNSYNPHPIVLEVEGLRLINVADFLAFSGALGAQSIEIPTWNQVVTLR